MFYNTDYNENKKGNKESIKKKNHIHYIMLFIRRGLCSDNKESSFATAIKFFNMIGLYI